MKLNRVVGTIALFSNISNNIDKSKISLNDIIEITKFDMNNVNNIIFKMAQSQSELIPKISNYLSCAGGKRIRPMLTLASSFLFGCCGNDAHVKLAAAVEFMHTATLLHDDVVDESDMRRGTKAARKIWGNQASVLVGDFLLGQAFTLMVEAGSMEALAVLSKAAAVIAEGEVMQLAASKSLNSSIDGYFAIINAKTAQLFSAATSVGAIIANAPSKSVDAITQYGQKIGIAFQLVDDILDYNGDAGDLGKNIGDDFREGKITLPVLLCIEEANKAEKDFWQKALCEGQNDSSNFEQALILLNKYNSLSKTIALAKTYGEDAKRALLSIESDINAEVLKALLNVVDFCIQRVG